MKKFIAVAGLLALAACGKKEEAMPAVDTTAVAPAPAMTDTMATMPDSTMARDTAHQM
jgi:predicted small lipoprotein YifL